MFMFEYVLIENRSLLGKVLIPVEKVGFIFFAVSVA